MKKSLLILATGLISGLSFSQVIFESNFENWTTVGTKEVPNGWMGSRSNIDSAMVTKVSGGTYSAGMAQLLNDTTVHKRFSTTDLSVELDRVYTVKVWARGNGSIRCGLHNGTAYQSYVDTLGTVNAYDSILATSPFLYTYTHTATATSTSGQFILSVRNTSGANHVQIDSVAIIAGSVTPPSTVTIYDIQYSTDVTGNSPLMDQNIATGGIVSATSAKGYWIQDANMAWSGVYVYDSVKQPAIGDSLTLRAKVVEYNGLTELSFVNNVVTENTGNTPHAPLLITTLAANDEQYESVLIRVQNAQVNTNLTFGRFLCSDGSGDAMVDDFLYFYPLPGQTDLFTFIQGVMDFSFSERKILPRNASDMNNAGIGINENTADLIRVYPNTVVNNVTITNAASSQVSIVGADGKIWKEAKLSSNAQELNLSSLAAGTYLVQIKSNDVVRSFRIVKQ